MYLLYSNSNYLYKDLNGGIEIAEMVYNSNLMVLVGGGESPKWPTNKCMLWDDAA